METQFTETVGRNRRRPQAPYCADNRRPGWSDRRRNTREDALLRPTVDQRFKALGL